jgi:guanine deaminase
MMPVAGCQFSGLSGGVVVRPDFSGGRAMADGGLRGDERFMRMAIELATENVRSGIGGPFGAVVVKDGKVVATGVNLVTGTNDPTAHAEVTAIRRACRELETYELTGCEIYSSCEPCPMCLTAILWARCDALYFACTAQDAAAAGFDDSHFYEQVALPVGERELPTKNLMRGEGNAAFEAWRTFAGRVEY